MLQLKNESPFSATLTLFPDLHGAETLYVVVRATFDVVGSSLRVAEQQVAIQDADEYRGDPSRSSIKKASDLHLLKPSTDVLLDGEAWAPRGRPASQVDVGLAVGPVKKTVRVLGDREWKGLLGEHISSPAPFDRMPLVYERAFGGVLQVDTHTGEPMLEPRNPAGVGFARTGKHGQITLKHLPNIEDPAHLIAHVGDRPPPAGFGPLAPSWEPRRSRAGTYDAAWQKTRAPYLPNDFDPRFFNIASPDLVCPSHLKGGEPVTVMNATPTGLLRFSLPRCDIDARVTVAGKVEQPRMQLETVYIDARDERLGLLWRGAVVVDKKALRVEEVHIGLKALDVDGRGA